MFYLYSDKCTSINAIRFIETSVSYLTSPINYWEDRYIAKYNSVPMAKRFEKYGTLREWEWNNYNERGWMWKEEVGTGYEIK